MRWTLLASAAAIFFTLGTGRPVAQQPRVQKVFVIAMENTNWTQPDGAVTGALQQIRGNPAAPFLNGLVDGTLTATVRGRTIVSQAAYAQAYHQVMATPTGAGAPHIHPSEPNYIWSEAGTNFGVTSDRPPYGLGGTNQDTTRHLCTLLGAAGKSWRSYQEDIDLVDAGSGLTNEVLPADQWTVPLTDRAGVSQAYTNPYNGSHQYNYAPKHNPPLFFTDTNGGNDETPANPMARHYAPLEQLRLDLERGTTADYNWISPDQYNDMHSNLLGRTFTYNGTRFEGAAARIAQADHFLSVIVPAIMASDAYRQNGAIVLWWDETEGTDSESYATTLPEIVISPLAAPNVDGKPFASQVPLSHSDDLRTMQDIFGVNPPAGVPYLGDAARARGLASLFAPGAVSPMNGSRP